MFDSNKVKKAEQKGIIIHRVFLERIGVLRLSVDRLNHAQLAEMAEISDEVARGRGKTFYGWAKLLVGDAEQHGRTVEASPQLSDRYHADIQLNINTQDPVDLKDLQTQHATELAAHSEWQPRPKASPAASRAPGA